ncbi:MAG: PrgI family protein [Candidatus Saccharibacteria bacterium]|nr:PrgI family protein [Candidatus Saccharibacteria bacterium]
MARYKVPQDVEADDKLIGPFSFRQFVYLLIAGGLIALAFGLFQLFPLLVILPIPLILFFGILALPLRKDQPMETYLAALISFYLKPHKRIWTPGQRESTIRIIAPKIVEASRTRDITGEEATHRLSFLADIVDTEGYAIKDTTSNPMREDLYAEANATSDMFENSRFDRIDDTIEKEENARHTEVINSMKRAIESNENMTSSFGAPMIQKHSQEGTAPARGFNMTLPQVNPTTSQASPAVLRPNTATSTGPNFNSPAVILPGLPSKKEEEKNEEVVEKVEEKVSQTPPKASIIELANNTDFSVATIAKEAKRIKERDKDEVFISLH